MPKRIRTRISQPFWCDPSDSYKFKPATIPPLMHAPGQTFWLDELFESGIVLPDTDEGTRRAVTMVLSGPPGTGKTTLAMELCCPCAEKREYGTQADDEIQRPLTSLYVSSEAHPTWMKHNAQSFRWPQVQENVGEDSQSVVRIVTAEDIKKTPLGSQHAYSHPGTFAVFIKTLKELLGGTNQEQPTVAGGHNRHFDTTTLPDIVVIDSLNTLPGDKLERYRHFMSFASAGPKLIIAIADSDPRGIAQDWEFAADIVVRPDEHFLTGYLQ